jgi:hypothetical protein
MYRVTNHRADKIKVGGYSIKRGQSILVSSSVITNAKLARLVARGKASISRVEQEPMVKLGVVPEPVVELPAPEPVVEAPAPEPVVETPAPEPAPEPAPAPVVGNTVEEEPAKPTIKRRTRRKSASKKED